MKLTAGQISTLISQPETAILECKLAERSLPDTLWESYSAFANTDGGIILLGIRENNGTFSIVGVKKQF